ncbi:hypothetical protein B0J14DRAFT_639462 [Halenospora varia]|nr:hypothetical protein B0J14DRAFT_639462 [Halenospora varia]
MCPMFWAALRNVTAKTASEILCRTHRQGSAAPHLGDGGIGTPPPEPKPVDEKLQVGDKDGPTELCKEKDSKRLFWGAPPERFIPWKMKTQIRESTMGMKSDLAMNDRKVTIPSSCNVFRAQLTYREDDKASPINLKTSYLDADSEGCESRSGKVRRILNIHEKKTVDLRQPVVLCIPEDRQPEFSKDILGPTAPCVQAITRIEDEEAYWRINSAHNNFWEVVIRPSSAQEPALCR